ncbi:MAG: tRNA (adenine-N1)-methyltransferase [Actinomycetota bacterium]
MHTITVDPKRQFHTHAGWFAHTDLIGLPEGSVVTSTGGTDYLAFRPLLSDYVMSMPRGAAVVYPKDSAQIIAQADIFAGAQVVEAGVGSGALTLSLLRAIGSDGQLISIERRADFAAVARGNVEAFFGAPHPAWQLEIGSCEEALPELVAPGSTDRVVFDMLAPWECLAAAAGALIPGGVLLCYVATVTQLSRTVEALREDSRWTEPVAWESMVRGWHVEGLAVRPQHRMIGHTGFLLTARKLADGTPPPGRYRRPAQSNKPTDERPFETSMETWTSFAMGENEVSPKKLRRVHRELGVAEPKKHPDPTDLAREQD